LNDVLTANLAAGHPNQTRELWLCRKIETKITELTRPSAIPRYADRQLGSLVMQHSDHVSQGLAQLSMPHLQSC
jgi:hypothetical protein